MDEPLSNLDASLRVRTRTEIKRLQRELGITTVFVTHDQEEAMVLSDRVAVMRDGKLQQIGPPMEVYRRPANLFVAGFIGSPAMNFLEVELARAGRAPAVPGRRRPSSTCRSRWSSPASLAGSAAARRSSASARPTSPSAPPRTGSALRGEVFLVEPIGPISYVDVDVEGRAVKAVADPDDGPGAGRAGRASAVPPAGCTCSTAEHGGAAVSEA